jgi:hypothetical protein
MHKYEFNVTITVPVAVEAEDVLAAKALIQDEADSLFETEAAMRADIPDLALDLYAVDNHDPSVEDVRKLLDDEGGSDAD